MIGQIGEGPAFRIESRGVVKCMQAGTLRLFANDAPGWFGNNTGSITVEGRVVDEAPPLPVEAEGLA